MVFHGAGHLFFGFAPGSDALARFERAMQVLDYRRALRVPPLRVRRALDEAMALLAETAAARLPGRARPRPIQRRA